MPEELQVICEVDDLDLVVAAEHVEEAIATRKILTKMSLYLHCIIF